MNVLAERLKLRRAELGWSQADLARRMPIPCSGSSIGTIETGETRNPRYIVEIAQALGVSVDWLKGLSDDPAPGPAATGAALSPDHLALLGDFQRLERCDPAAARLVLAHVKMIADLAARAA
ncbi:MAG TPA: helix-turn-helix transcriptional regulator [Azospirillaceae bacterium]|nr:helix-turn-helix transcriptional regulator [Azospirillaceae bacterium]